jgi:hypothetical protein
MTTTVAGSVTGVSLEVPAEPVELRVQIRDAVLGGADWIVAFGEELGVGDYLWEQWGPALERAGMSRTTFTTVVASYRRELWYWLLGDRQWSPAVTGLAGRLLRRLPAG